MSHERMKVMSLEAYGPPSALRLEEVERPIPKAGEVRVQVHAASLNDWDLGILRGEDLLTRLLYGLRRPKVRILGCDVAGRVEALGPGVKHLRVGDAVFGDLCASGFGAFAECVCAPEETFALKPEAMTFAQAAAMPQAATLAVQALRAGGGLRPGQHLLINGAGGGVGTFALQLAKLQGAVVSAVDRGEKLDRLLALGADHVVDYTREDFTKLDPKFDLILDVKTRRSIRECVRPLRRNGVYVTVGGTASRLLQALAWKPWISVRDRKAVRIVAMKPNRDLPGLVALFEAGKVVPVIDRCYPMVELPEAFQRFEGGHHMGKVILSMSEASAS